MNNGKILNASANSKLNIIKGKHLKVVIAILPIFLEYILVQSFVENLKGC
jgi:hypothetical protein